MTIEELRNLAPNISLGEMGKTMGLTEDAFAELVVAVLAGPQRPFAEIAWELCAVGAVVGYVYAKRERVN
jgi:hypothetical protein